MKPMLEINQNHVDKTTHYVIKDSQLLSAGIMVSPETDENYWVFRVKLCKDQAVVGFLKYGIIGVGMALEENTNTNLPLFPNFSTEYNAERIALWIECNKKHKSITHQMIVDAIILIDKGARQYGLLK